MPTLNEKTRSGVICLAVYARSGGITWKFDDGTEVETDHDLSTRRGRRLFAQVAEALGLGHRAGIHSIVRRWQHQDGPILQRPLG